MSRFTVMAAAAIVATTSGSAIEAREAPAGAALTAALLAANDTEGTPWASVTEASLAHAVAALEAATGGKVLEIRFRDNGAQGAFDAVIAKKDALVNMTIDVVSDAVTEIKVTELPQWMLDWKARAAARSAEKAKLPLPEAIAKAEAVAHGTAIAAGLAKPLTADNRVLAYNVEVVGKGKPQRVVIDAVTGQVIADPDELLEGWTPEKLLPKS
jgi:uncharacterized membrane protein YkoI